MDEYFFQKTHSSAVHVRQRAESLLQVSVQLKTHLKTSKMKIKASKSKSGRFKQTLSDLAREDKPIYMK